MTDADAPRQERPSAGDYSGLPGVGITLGQLVAYNLAYFRKAALMTQAELGERTGLSFRAISAAERTWDRTDGKGRVFDAELIARLAHAFDVPFSAFFLPPTDDGISKRYTVQLPVAPGHGADEYALTMRDIAWLALSDPSDDDTEVMRAYRSRYAAALNAYLPPEVGERLAAARGDTTAQEFRAQLLERLQSQRAALAEIIGDIDQQVDAIVSTRPADD